MRRVVPLIFFAALASARAAGADTPSSSSTSDPWALYRRGYDAMAAGEWQNAHALLTEAWALKHSTEIAGLLGQVENHLCQQQAPAAWCDEYPDAAEHLSFALRNVAGSQRTKADSRARLQELLAEVQSHLVTLKIQAPDGAEVLMDERSLGVAPLPDVVFVKSGPHRVQARERGILVAMTDITANKGEERAITLVRSTSSGEPAPSAPVVAPPETRASESHRNLLPAYLLGGAAVASAGVAVFLSLSANSDQRDVDRDIGQLQPGACAAGTARAADCNALSDTLKSHNSKVTASHVFYGIAGVATAATIIYILWPSPATPRAAAQARLGLNISGTSLSLSGAF